MKHRTDNSIIILVFLSIMIQVVFIQYLINISMRNKSITIRDKFKNAALLSTGMEKSYSIFSASASTLILRLPSIDNSGKIIENTYDHMVADYKDEFLTLFLFPENSSVRENNRYIIKNIHSLNFGKINSLFYMKCSIYKHDYIYRFNLNNRHLKIPATAGVM